MVFFRRARLSWETVLLAGLAAAAFGIRWHYTLYHPVMVPDYDGADYLNLAGNVFRGEGFYHIFIPPGMPLLLSLALPFFDEPQTAGMFVSALFGAGLCLAVYLFARELFDKKTAFLAAALTALFGQLVISSTWVMTEMVFASFVFAGLYTGLVFHRRRDAWSALGYGALFGAAYYFRPEAFMFFFGSGAVLALWELAAGRQGRKRFFAGLALAVVLFLALCFPYMLYLRHALGHWSISGKVQYNIARGDAAAGGEGTARYIMENLGALKDRYLDNLPKLKFLAAENYPAVLLALAAFGMAVSLFWGRLRPMGFFMPMVLFAYALLLPFFFVDPRIMGPYYPVVLVWGAAGASFIEDKLLSMRWLRPAARFYPVSAALALLLGVHYITGINGYVGSEQFRYENAYLSRRYLDMGRWLKDNSAEGDKVFSREILLVHYSGRKYIHLPDWTPETLWAKAREEGARFVIVDDICIRKRKALGPLLSPFMGPAPKVAGFSLMYLDLDSGVMVYRVEGAS